MATQWVNVESIGSYFESLSDPRHTRNRKHLLIDVVVIAVCGLVCGCDGPTALHRWAANRLDCSSSSSRSPRASPRATASVGCCWPCGPRPFRSASGLDRPRPAARRRRPRPAGRHRRQNLSTLPRRGQRFSARCTSSAPGPREEGVALGQIATEHKSNELTAIPQLLKRIELTGALITIDAMGCQKDIARDIVAGGGDFAIAVKDNQPKLREAIEAYFLKHLESDLEDLRYRSYETSEQGRGRLDERSYFLTKRCRPTSP